DGDGVVVDVERAGGFARRRTDTAGHLRKVVGGVQVARSLLPVAAVDQVVPVRDLVVDRAASRRARREIGAVAIRDAAVQAARGLRSILLLGERQHEFAPMLDALLDRLVVAVGAFEFEKPGDLAHRSILRSTQSAGRDLSTPSWPDLIRPST